MDKILFHQRLIPNYQIGLMERFCEKFTNTIILYGNEKKNEPLTNAKINSKYFLKIKNIYPLKQPSFFFSFVIKTIIKQKPKSIITQGSIGNLTLIVFFLLRPFFNYKIILWGHGWNRKKNSMPSNSMEDKYRLFLQKKSDAVIVYSEESKNVLKEYINKNKIFVANNTIDTTELNKIYEKLTKAGKDKVKEGLDIKEKFNIIFLGRLVIQKNLMLLVKLIKEINSADVCLHFIGDGPTALELKEYCKSEKLNKVNFHGQLSDNQKMGEILYSCDLMIIPRAVGLSAVHSFVFGVPVMVLENIGHGPEIEFINHNENGFKEYNKTISEIATNILDFLNNKELQQKFSRNARSVIETSVNTEKFLYGFEEALKFVCKN